MNNREGLEFLKSKTSVRDGSTNFMDDHHLGADQYHKIRYQFGELKDSRDLYRKKMTSILGKISCFMTAVSKQ